MKEKVIRNRNFQGLLPTHLAIVMMIMSESMMIFGLIWDDSSKKNRKKVPLDTKQHKIKGGKKFQVFFSAHDYSLNYHFVDEIFFVVSIENQTK